MSNKEAKKIRQLFRRKYEGLVYTAATSDIVKRILKPKPKWWPMWFYRFMVKKLIGKL